MLAGCPDQRYPHFDTFANTTYNLLESLLAFFDILGMSVSVASARRFLGPNFALNLWDATSLVVLVVAILISFQSNKSWTIRRCSLSREESCH
jgi:hypothetical protein